MTNLLTEEDLKQWLGYQNRADLVKALNRAQIPYALGKGGCITTTQGAIDGALLRRGAQDSGWDNVMVGA